MKETIVANVSDPTIFMATDKCEQCGYSEAVERLYERTWVTVVMCPRCGWTCIFAPSDDMGVMLAGAVDDDFPESIKKYVGYGASCIVRNGKCYRMVYVIPPEDDFVVALRLAFATDPAIDKDLSYLIRCDLEKGEVVTIAGVCPEEMLRETVLRNGATSHDDTMPSEDGGD